MVMVMFNQFIMVIMLMVVMVMIKRLILFMEIVQWCYLLDIFGADTYGPWLLSAILLQHSTRPHILSCPQLELGDLSSTNHVEYVAFSVWVPPNVKSKIEVYRCQPRSILEYEPGYSSVSFREERSVR